jgi:hypothetical protein
MIEPFDIEVEALPDLDPNDLYEVPEADRLDFDEPESDDSDASDGELSGETGELSGEAGEELSVVVDEGGVVELGEDDEPIVFFGEDV